VNELIDKLAYEAASAFINQGVDLNESIKAPFLNGVIENTEVLKRVCEEANKQVKLAMLQDTQPNGTVKFNFASPEKIMGSTNTGLGDYAVAPKREVPTLLVEKTASDLDYSREANHFSTSLDKFAAQADNEHLLCEKKCVDGITKIAKMVNGFITDGYSVPDLCKIASVVALNEVSDKTVAMEVPTFIMKIAEDFSKRGLKVEMSKTAGVFDVDARSPFASAVAEFSREMVKSAAYLTMAAEASSFSKELKDASTKSI